MEVCYLFYQINHHLDFIWILKLRPGTTTFVIWNSGRVSAQTSDVVVIVNTKPRVPFL
jgi:hypothetical protein